MWPKLSYFWAFQGHPCLIFGQNWIQNFQLKTRIWPKMLNIFKIFIKISPKIRFQLIILQVKIKLTVFQRKRTIIKQKLFSIHFKITKARNSKLKNDTIFLKSYQNKLIINIFELILVLDFICDQKILKIWF